MSAGRIVDEQPDSRIRGAGQILLGIIIAALLVAACLLVPTDSAHAAVASIATDGPGLTLRTGGHHRGAFHAGSYVLDGKQMYCISYGLASGDGAIHEGTVSPQEAYVRVKWGDTTNPVQAADVDLALNSLAGNAAFDADLPSYLAQLPDRGARVHAMLAEAARLAGPWHLTIDTPHALPGNPVTAHVTVTSATGSPVPAAVVTVKVIGGTAPTTATTDGAGVASVPVVPSALSYTLAASVQSPGTAVLTNTPSRGRQTLIGAGPLRAIGATGCASVCPASAVINVGAPCQHGTAATVTVTWTTPDLPGAITGTLSVAGQPTDTALVRGGQTSATVQVPIGSPVTIGWSVGGVSGTLRTFTVGS